MFVKTGISGFSRTRVKLQFTREDSNLAHSASVSFYYLSNKGPIPTKMSRNERKHTLGHMRPRKTHVSMCIHAVRPESSLGAFWHAKDAKILHADNEDAVKTAWMRRQNVVFVERHVSRYVFLRCGSYSRLSCLSPEVWMVLTISFRISKGAQYAGEVRVVQSICLVGVHLRRRYQMRVL